MTGRHWTEDDFLNHVYRAAAAADEAHLGGCGECRAQLQRFEERRSLITREPEIPTEFLAAQRRAIYRKLDKSAGHPFRWASALAAAFMLVMGLIFFRPGQIPQAVTPTPDDSVFAEVYSLEQNSEPQAAKPIEALFEEN